MNLAAAFLGLIGVILIYLCGDYVPAGKRGGDHEKDP